MRWGVASLREGAADQPNLQTIFDQFSASLDHAYNRGTQHLSLFSSTGHRKAVPSMCLSPSLCVVRLCVCVCVHWPVQGSVKCRLY